MEILLFNPYYSQKREYYSFYRPAPPISLMYLAAYLRKFGLKSKIYELGIGDIKKAIFKKNRVRFGLSDKKIENILKKEKPKIVGVTSMYSVYFRDVLEICRTIKKFDRKIKTVVGGNHASSYYQYILKDKNIDFVVIGEGEQTLLELSQAILKGRKDFSKINGLAYRKKGKILRTRERELIKNLDEIPFPAYDLIDYHSYSGGEPSPYLMRPNVGVIISSRGCPGHCVYCTVKAVWGRTWRGRSPKNVVDEIEFLMKEFSVSEIAFLDDSASVDKKRWNGICDEIIKRKINIKWMTPNGIAHWTLDKPTLRKMHQSGCYRVTFGIESGNPETRRFLGKPYPLQQAKEIIQYANKIGMWTICTNIIGFPYEKLDSILDTIEFAKKSGTDFATFYLLIPQPTSDVYSYFRKEKLLNFDGFFERLKIDENEFEKINYVLNETGSDTKYFKKEELRVLQKRAYREFLVYRALDYFFHPYKLVQKVHSFEDLLYLLRLIRHGLAIVIRTVNPLNLKSSDFLYKKETLNEKGN